MAESPFFETASETLEKSSGLNRLAARGTLRFALRASGFDSRTVNRPQLLAAILRSLPDELVRRGVEDVESVCERVAEAVATAEGAAEAPPD